MAYDVLTHDELIRAALRAEQRLMELLSAQEALRESGRCKDHFLAVLAHALRNPIAPVANVLQILRMRQDGRLRQNSFNTRPLPSQDRAAAVFEDRRRRHCHRLRQLPVRSTPAH